MGKEAAFDRVELRAVAGVVSHSDFDSQVVDEVLQSCLKGTVPPNCFRRNRTTRGWTWHPGNRVRKSARTFSGKRVCSIPWADAGRRPVSVCNGNRGSGCFPNQNSPTRAMDEHDESLEVGIAAGLDVPTAMVLSERDDRPPQGLRSGGGNCRGCGGSRRQLAPAPITGPEIRLRPFSDRTGPLRRFHHRIKLLRTDKQPIRMAGQLAEVPSLIECLGSVVYAVKDHGNKREGLAGLPAIAQGLGQEQIRPSPALVAMSSRPATPAPLRATGGAAILFPLRPASR